ncbi:hypothetical protein FEZ63_09105 [Microvirga brassicacearum]|uniref:Septum formation inhibitor MinC C-terminal domain-containing protein n=1 Tax=Microvirga brassicacearum TaxID=2580413 RepID=A0A5N3PDF4_9HYPH|nr:hypothetical protein FEZ63_09105 [Microvirga brassicacearum]
MRDWRADAELARVLLRSACCSRRICAQAAGGSIHIYGSLRGRAVAGYTGNSTARIFCRKFEAELVAVNGLYKTTDDLGSKFRNLPIQVRLDGDSLILTLLDPGAAGAGSAKNRAAVR